MALSIVSAWEVQIKTALGKLQVGSPIGEFLDSAVLHFDLLEIAMRHVRSLAVGYDRACVVDVHGKVLCLPFEPTATFFGRTQATSVGAGVRMLDELEDGSIACWGAMDEPGTLVWSRQCSRPLLGSNVWCAETPASIYLPTSFVPYKKSEP